MANDVQQCVMGEHVVCWFHLIDKKSDASMARSRFKYECFAAKNKKHQWFPSRIILQIVN